MILYNSLCLLSSQLSINNEKVFFLKKTNIRQYSMKKSLFRFNNKISYVPSKYRSMFLNKYQLISKIKMLPINSFYFYNQNKYVWNFITKQKIHLNYLAYLKYKLSKSKDIITKKKSLTTKNPSKKWEVMLYNKRKMFQKFFMIPFLGTYFSKLNLSKYNINMNISLFNMFIYNTNNYIYTIKNKTLSKFLKILYLISFFSFGKIKERQKYLRFIFKNLILLYKSNKNNLFFNYSLSMKKRLVSLVSYKNIVAKSRTIWNFYKTSFRNTKNLLNHDSEKMLLLLYKNRIFPLYNYLSPTKKLVLFKSEKLASSFISSRLINVFVFNGLKYKQERYFFRCFRNIKRTFNTTKFPILFSYRFLSLFFSLYSPKLTIRGVKRGSVVFKVPSLIVPYQQHSISLKWFKDAVYIRYDSLHSSRLFKETLDILDKNFQTQTVKKKILLHKLILDSRSFSHYRWL